MKLQTSLARAVLDNGVVVLAKEAHTTPAVTINVAVRAGSICDPPDTPGAAYLLSRVIDRGTASRSADDIAEELDSRGIALTTVVTRHLFSIVCTCLADDFEPPAEFERAMAELGQDVAVLDAEGLDLARRFGVRSTPCAVRTGRGIHRGAGAKIDWKEMTTCERSR